MKARYSAKRRQSLESWAATPPATNKPSPKMPPGVLLPRGKRGAATVSDAEKLVQKLQEEVAALEARVAQADENIHGVQSELAETVAAFAVLGQQIAVLEQEIAELRTSLPKMNWRRPPFWQALLAGMVGGAVGLLAQVLFL